VATAGPFKKIIRRQKIENRVISVQEISDKYLILSETPAAPESVVFDPGMGPNLMPGLHYAVSQAVVSWDGLGLDGIIIEGDNYRIQYDVLSLG